MKVLDFYADWCGPCQMQTPILEEVEKSHPDVEFVRINIDEQRETAEKYQIISIPTLIFLDDKDNVIDQLVGLQSKRDIEKILDKQI